MSEHSVSLEITDPSLLATTRESLIADMAVKRVFAVLGVDIDKPESVEAFREDLRFSKKLRKMSDHAFLAMVALVASALVLAAWAGIQAILSGKR